MDTRDKHTPVNSSTATHAEMDELLRQIEALEARLAAKDAASREPAAESEIANLGSLAAYSSTMVSQSFPSLTEAAARYCRAARATPNSRCACCSNRRRPNCQGAWKWKLVTLTSA